MSGLVRTIQMTKAEILYELSISVACLLDDVEEIGGYDIITAQVKDIEHIQNLITKLENEE
jgi:flavin reductase (DIM6/NTAB) family NADH-FMN oxidoreductase RutF